MITWDFLYLRMAWDSHWESRQHLLRNSHHRTGMAFSSFFWTVYFCSKILKIYQQLPWIINKGFLNKVILSDFGGIDFFLLASLSPSLAGFGFSASEKLCMTNFWLVLSIFYGFCNFKFDFPFAFCVSIVFLWNFKCVESEYRTLHIFRPASKGNTKCPLES